MSFNNIMNNRRENWIKDQVVSWNASVPPALQGYDMDDLLGSRWNGKISQANVSKLKKYLKNPEKFLVLTGSSGLGKTVMGVEVCSHLLKNNMVPSALYADTSTVLSELSFPERGDNPIDKYSRPGVLLLDDVGAFSTDMTAVRKTGLGAIINNRWLSGKYTIITTNLSPVSLDDEAGMSLKEYLGESSWDRVISSYLLITFAGNSMRRTVLKAQRAQEWNK